MAASPRLKRQIKLALFADWHSAHDDERGEPFRQYSCRMAQWHHPMAGVLDGLLNEAADKGRRPLSLPGT